MVSVWPGQSCPLGATYDGTGTNFSVYSFVADGVELCPFDDDGGETRLELPGQPAPASTGMCPTSGPGSGMKRFRLAKVVDLSR